MLIAYLLLSLQQPVPRLIPDAPSCATCKIELVRVRSVTSRPQDAELIGAKKLARDSRGRFYTTNSTVDRVLVFDSSGTYQRAFGKAGQGPGEVGRINAIKVGPNDSIWVFLASRRFLVFSQAGTFARSGTMAVGLTGTPLQSSQLLVTAPGRTEESAGNQVHVLQPDGKFAFSFQQSPPLSPTCQQCTSRAAIVALKGEYWSLGGGRYLIQKWTKDGRLSQTLERLAPWFPPIVPSPNRGAYAASEVVPRGQTPGPIIVMDPNRVFRPILEWITEDSSGVLWIGATRRFGNSTSPVIRIVEAVDPASGALLATLRRLPTDSIDAYITPLSGGYVWTTRQSSDGYYAFDIWKLALRRN